MMKQIFGRLRSKKKQEDKFEEKKWDNDSVNYLRPLNEVKPKPKWLLLGIGGSGKSTICKQLDIIYNNTRICDESKKATNKIKENILSDIYYLCIENIRCLLFIKHLYLNIFIPTQIINIISTYYYGSTIKLTKQSQIICKEIISLKNSNNSSQFQLTTDLATKISILWNQIGLRKECIMDNTQYFINNIDRICKHEYIANTKDYIRLKNSTTDIIEKYFYYIPPGNDDKFKWHFQVTDIGGNILQRKKWSKCFDDDINVILYVMALDEYDKPNCYRDALNLFEKTMRNEALSSVLVCVIFNKNDLFIKKIKEIPFSVFEPNFNKDHVHNADAVKQYLQNEFKKRLSQKILFYVTSAIDTKQIETVLELIAFQTVRIEMMRGMVL